MKLFIKNSLLTQDEQFSINIQGSNPCWTKYNYFTIFEVPKYKLTVLLKNVSIFTKQDFPTPAPPVINMRYGSRNYESEFNRSIFILTNQIAN